MAPDVHDRNRGQALPSGLSDDAYARLGWTLERRANRRPPVHRGAGREDSSPSEMNSVGGDPTYVGRRFASIAEAERAGFRRVAACTYIETGFRRQADAAGSIRQAHPIWELRTAEDGPGYLLVRKKEERDVDLRTATHAGVGTEAAIAAGIVRSGRSQRTASRRTAAPKFQVSLLQTPGGSIADRKTILTNEPMDLDEIERLVHEIKMGPAELNADTWTDGEWELRVRGPKGEYIHEYEATEPGEIGGEKGRGLIDMLEGAVNAPPPGEEAILPEGVEPMEEPPADLGAPGEEPPAMEPPPPGPGGEPAAPETAVPPEAAAGVEALTPPTARVRQGQRVLCIRRGQVADAVVMMVRPEMEAVDLMFGGGGMEENVPMEMLLEPDLGGGMGGEGGVEVEMVGEDGLEMDGADEPFEPEVEPASKGEPVVFGLDDIEDAPEEGVEDDGFGFGGPEPAGDDA